MILLVAGLTQTGWGGRVEWGGATSINQSTQEEEDGWMKVGKSYRY